MKTCVFGCFILMIMIPQATYGQYIFLEPPAMVFDGMAYFNREKYMQLQILEYKKQENSEHIINLHLSVFVELSSQNENELEGTEQRFNEFFDVSFRCGDYFWLSLFVSGINGYSKFNSLKIESEENFLFAGGGLAFRNDLFFS